MQTRREETSTRFRHFQGTQADNQTYSWTTAKMPVPPGYVNLTVGYDMVNYFVNSRGECGGGEISALSEEGLNDYTATPA
jgi:hypothetical protein